MKKRIAKGMAYGMVAGASSMGGLFGVIEAAVPSGVESVRTCASEIGTTAMVAAIYKDGDCSQFSKDFRLHKLPHPAAVELGATSVSVLVTGPSAEEFLVKEVPKAESNTQSFHRIEGLIVLAAALAGTGMGAALASTRRDELEHSVAYSSSLIT